MAYAYIGGYRHRCASEQTEKGPAAPAIYVREQSIRHIILRIYDLLSLSITLSECFIGHIIILFTYYVNRFLYFFCCLPFSPWLPSCCLLTVSCAFLVETLENRSEYRKEKGQDFAPIPESLMLVGSSSKLPNSTFLIVGSNNQFVCCLNHHKLKAYTS